MEVADPELVARALGTVAVWPPDLAPDERFTTLDELVATGLAERIARRLRAPARVGASALVMGLAARLWSLTVVPAVTHGVVLDPGQLRARDDDGSLVLGVAEPVGRSGVTPAELHALVLGILEPVVARLQVAPRVLWGDVAASLYAVPRVHRLAAAEPLARDLLARPPYAGELEPGGRRRTCCLFYLAPGAGLCGDCVLDEVPVTPAR